MLLQLGLLKNNQSKTTANIQFIVISSSDFIFSIIFETDFQA